MSSSKRCCSDSNTGQLNKDDKGALLRFLSRVSGYSEVQIKRLVQQYLRTGKLRYQQRTSVPFTRKYTSADIHLLAHTDEWHGTLSGPATKKLFERAYTVFEDHRYERLADISVAHLYNLRHSVTYTRQQVHYEKTRPVKNTIGQRRRPQPKGQPGYVRIDTVHQGDLNRQKGVYHINATDEVTQFEFVFTVAKISERYLLPVLEALLACFPFTLINFHADKGSEYINKRVAALLKKRLIEFTKSRSRKTKASAPRLWLPASPYLLHPWSRAHAPYLHPCRQ